MPRKTKFGNRKFGGNQHTSKPKGSCSTDADVGEPATRTSSSMKKISFLDQEVFDKKNSNIIIDISVLTDLLQQSVKCKHCNQFSSMVAEIDDKQPKGLAVSITFRCTICSIMTTSMSSRISKNKYDINVRLVYGMRCIGKGKKAAEVFCAMMNLPPPPQKFASFQDTLLDSLNTVSTCSMKSATEETVALAGGGRDIAAAFDGSWQKRGHTSLNGIVVCTSLENGKVMDFECVTKYCSQCVNNPDIDHNCDKNYSGSSGGMEVAGVLKVFQRSEAERQVRYLDYLGDGDCKAYDQVVKCQVYGPHTTIDKLECVGHVQKRMGTRLRKLKMCYKKKKLSDGKGISGRGRLTDRQINLLQSYYGMAIRNNVGKPIKEMQKAVWSIYFHKLSTDDCPQHGLCPNNEETWCKYNLSKIHNKGYKHNNSLPEPVMLALKPVFKALSDPKLLSKCSHGKTQNVNECFNRCVWDRLPKTSFNGLKSLKIGVMDAVLCFNDGAQKRIEVFRNLGIEPGHFTFKGLECIDVKRIHEANLASVQASKEARKAKQNRKRKIEMLAKQDTSVYGAGSFN